MAKITLVIPAFNEEAQFLKERETGFFKALKEWKREDSRNRKIVLVDDGSTDKTAAVAKSRRVKVIPSDPKAGKNLGKGAAFYAGALEAKRNGSDILVSLDADITNLTPENINLLVKDLLKPPAEHMKFKPKMVLSCRTREKTDARYATMDSIYYLHPTCCGVRAIYLKALMPFLEEEKREKFHAMCDGFRLELGLNHLIPQLALSEARFSAEPGFRKGRDGQLSDLADVKLRIFDRAVYATVLRQWLQESRGSGRPRRESLKAVKEFFENAKRRMPHLR